MKYVAVIIGAFAALFAANANAVPVIQFAQTSGSNTITATANGTDTATTISGSNVAVNIAQNLGGFTGGALFTISATSTDSAVPVGTGALQHYSGNFCITASAGCGGTNYLSGTFSDAALGVGGALTLAVGAPPDVANFSSDLITSAELGLPIALAFSLTNVIPPINIVGSTIGNFTATISGNMSATAVAVPEVSSIAPFLVGIGALAMLRRKKNAA